MPHRIETCPCEGRRPRSPGARFPDLKNRFRIGWRDVLSGLAGPAQRLHRYRNARAALFDAAAQRLDDCEDQ